MRLFIKIKKHGRMMLNSIDNGPLVYLIIEEDGQTRLKKYSKPTESQQLQDDCDVQETNIILHGLSPNVYALINHQEAAKDIWDKVKLLMKGTKLSYQEHECRLYNLFDKFASVQVSPQPFISPLVTQQPQAEFPQMDSGLAVPTFQQGEDLFDYINKAMAILSAVASREKGIWQESALSQKGQEILHDPKITKALVAQQTIPQNLAFQTKDLDAYDSNCDDISSTKAILMVNLSSCDSDVLSEDNSRANQNGPSFNQLFKINELKAQSQEKDMVIRKLKDKIKSLSGKDIVEKVKKDIDEIETINIKLEHSMAKLLSKSESLRKEREHLKSIYKDQFDSIKKTRVQSKEHSDSLIAQINAKSVENSNLNAQLKENGFAIAALKNKLKKLKRKNVVDTVVLTPIATTITPGMFKLDIELISHRLKHNRDAHEDYL
nr:hypothetical protein [Tanacetum cinerariifolium]